MEILAAFAILLALFAGAHPVKDRPQGEVNIETGAGDQLRVREVVKPLSEIQKDRLVRQSYDYSCGSAALATLLNYQLGESFTEKQVIHGLLQYGDKEKIAQRRAFSLLDMKKFVGKLGYKGVGYKAEISDLETLERPCIVPIKIFQYRHFAVLKGIYKGHIFLADPWRGHISFTLPEFQDMWYENVAFIVYPEGAPELHALRLKEDDLRFIDEDAARQIVLDRPGGPDFTEGRRLEDLPGPSQSYKP